MELTSKEIELRSGVPRASIRYYEAEGLLTPLRGKNGYRDYSERDLEELEKIKLLRRLGVSLEELRGLQHGTLQLPAVLSDRMAALAMERETLSRVEQVCGELRERGATFDTLDVPRYLKALDEVSAPPALPETDALPTVCSIPRRLLARVFDWLVTLYVLMLLLAAMGHNPAGVSNLPMNFALAVVLLLVEPLLLRLFGTTPGKALLGLHLAGPDGTHLSYQEGFTRMLMLAWYGLGVGIPIWNLVQLYRSAKRCTDGEPQPWDADVAYTAQDLRPRHVVGFLLALALVLGVGETVNSFAQLPPNRGALTVAEFAENFNRQADYFGLDFGGYLDENGRWQTLPDPPNIVVMTMGEPWEEARQFQYTVENGVLTAVTLSAERENVTDWLSFPKEEMMVAMLAFVWAQKDVPLRLAPRKALLEDMGTAGIEGYALRQAGVDITLTVERSGFAGGADLDLLIPSGNGKNRIAFTFALTLEN